MTKGRARAPEVFLESGVFLDANGNIISTITPYTFAEFTDSGFTLSAARHIKVTDKHSCVNGVSTPGSLWYVDPSAASSRKRQLVSGPIYSSTFANALSDYTPSTYPGLLVYCADIKNIVYNDGTNYRLLNTTGVIISEVNGSIASPTKSLPNTALVGSQLFTLNNATLPANLCRAGDIILINFQAKRHGTGSMTFVLALGTGAGLTDAQLFSQSPSATDNGIISATIRCTVASSTKFHTNNTSSLQQAGSSTTALADQSTNVNFAATQTFKLGLSAKSVDTDYLDLLTFTVQVLHP